ncbi:MAG: FAD-dependent oxidoreductase, partial [Pseudolabrys sp.]
MSAKKHDLVVIGAGPGGYVAAIRAAQLGMNVACVEQEHALGGTCLRIGCIPSKALLESSERFRETGASLKVHGVKTGRIQLDLAVLMKRKTDVVTTLTKGVDTLFRKNGITRYAGHGRITGPGTVSVNDGKQSIDLQAASILIATGSKPAPLKGVELHKDRIGTSTEALSYREVPRHLVVIGAGYIG